MLTSHYFNHAHNDLLEIALGGGIPAIAMLATIVGWWSYASFRVWRLGTSAKTAFAQAGSAMIFLTIISSFFDYPLRTPNIMAMVAIASAWLAESQKSRAGAPLPAGELQL